MNSSSSTSSSSSSSDNKRRTEIDDGDDCSPPAKKAKSTTSADTIHDQEGNSNNNPTISDEGNGGGGAGGEGGSTKRRQLKMEPEGYYITQGEGNAKILQSLLDNNPETLAKFFVQQQGGMDALTKLNKFQNLCKGEIIKNFFNNNTEIWIHKILPFLGPGNYIVASTCRRLNELYQIYYSTIDEKKIPMVRYDPYARREVAAVTDTYYSSVFSSLSCAKYWDHHSEGSPLRLPDNEVCSIVAKYGNLEVLKWARRQKRFPWNEDTWTNAARFGHLHILKWARKNGCPWTSMAFFDAARGGHLEVLKWAHKNEYPWNANYCAAAAEGGHLHILRWARDKGCRWKSSYTVESAARGGHLAVLQWVLDNGCPLEPQTLEQLIRNGRQEVVDWLRANGYLEPEEED